MDVTPANVGDMRDQAHRENKMKKNMTKSDLHIGDQVRISKVKSVFAKGYLPNWTEEIFTIHSINQKYSPITYKLKDYHGEVIQGSFYRNEIQSIIHEEQYLVEKVIRNQRRGNIMWSLVKWRDYPSSMNSWVRKADTQKLNRREYV